MVEWGTKKRELPVCLFVADLQPSVYVSICIFMYILSMYVYRHVFVFVFAKLTLTSGPQYSPSTELHATLFTVSICSESV